MKQEPDIHLIAAISLNYALGKNNKLLYHIKKDMQLFKKFTTDNIIIMGRNTYESLPKGALPNRINIVVSRQMAALDAPGCLIYDNLDKAIENAKKLAMAENKEIFIIGGGSIYKQALDKDLVSVMHLTVVLENVDDADTWFPDIDPNKWEVCYTEPTNDDQPMYFFQTLKKKV